MNPKAAFSLDFERQDWWGSDYEAFLLEIEGYRVRGWTIKALRYEKSGNDDGPAVAYLLIPPDKEETEEEDLWN